MNIKDAFFWTGLQTGIKVLSGIVINKVIAIYLGPAGLAFIGQFQNSVGLLTSISNGSIQTGVVSNIAKAQSEKEHVTVRTNAIFIMVLLSISVSIIVSILPKYFNDFLFLSSGYSGYIYLISLSLIFYAFNIYLISVLNGLGRVKEYAFFNILLNIIIAILVSLLTVLYGISGAISGFVISQIIFFFLFLFLNRLFTYSLFRFDFELLNKKVIKNLLSYGCASFLSGLIISMMLIGVRHIIINHIDQVSAGYWEGGYKIGLYYNMIFTLPISIYYLPIFSASKCKGQLNSYILNCIKFCIMGLLVIGCGILFFRDYIIKLLFSDDFYFISDFIFVILLSEAVRTITSIFSTFLYANRCLKVIIINESMWAAIFISLSYVFIGQFGLKGILYGYLIACVIQLVLVSSAATLKINTLVREKNLCS
ncbi:oligosaccharide flippase family protein [Vibrio fluvialis]|nr:oligosaccharide flippase family protein [Vibrio fluvialis]